MRLPVRRNSVDPVKIEPRDAIVPTDLCYMVYLAFTSESGTLSETDGRYKFVKGIRSEIKR
jgi:hypothetical protein